MMDSSKLVNAEFITLDHIVKLFSPKGLYLVTYGWLFGMSVWVSFFGGIIALRALPRHQFGALQSRSFPVYFGSSLLLTSILLGLWTNNHPDIVSNIYSPTIANVAQVYALGSVLVLQGINYFVLGPVTTTIMFQRHKLEKAEGKSYNEPGVSAEMKALSSKFGRLHGLSSLANLFAVVALAFHGLSIAQSY